MSSTLSPRNESSSRTWWPLSKSTSYHSSKDIAKTFPEKPTTAKSHSSLKFNTLASAIGLKSKKHGALAIQESVALTRSSTQPTVYNRPPSKSVSSTRSRGDSIGPHTPTDGQRDPPNNRHSLLTLSDTDPFAPSPVLSPASYVSSDPNRLSAYSSNSDYGAKRNDMARANRGSYASSSSASNNFGGITGESFPLPPTPPISDAPRRKLTTQKSTGSLHRKASMMNSIPTMATALESFPKNLASLPKSESSVTITEKPRLRTMSNSQLSVSVASRRPTMRSRGLTEGSILYSDALNEGVKYNSSDTNLSSRMQPSYPPTPRVVVRQASSSRLRHPPSAPPAHELPPPPMAYIPVYEDRDALGLPSASSSSSSLSFATSVSLARENIQARTGKLGIMPKQSRGHPLSPAEIRSDWDHTPGQSTRAAYPNGSRTLKKAVSHQALAQPTLPPQTALPSPPKPRIAPKSRSKERHFHPPRLALPLRHATSFNSQSHPIDDPTTLEQRRDTTGSSSTYARKRLFSGSSARRPSTSQTILSENDVHSLFSSPSEPDTSHPQMLFWDEALLLERPSVPSPPPESIDYTPQQIMSPAEIASFERSVEERSIYTRRRGYSIMSASTIASERDGEIPSPLSLSPTMKLSTLPMRVSTISANTCFSSASALSIPSSSPAAVALGSPPLITDSPRPASPVTPTPGAINSPGAAHDNDNENVHLMKRNDTQATSINSLPPPPRPRRRPATTESAVNPVFRASDTLSPLAPPPRRTNSTFGTHVPLGASRVRPPAGKGHRLSIFRKPSFLEIDDDDDPGGSTESGLGMRHVITLTERDRPIIRNGQLPVRTSAKVQDSFLDLARESFDSARS